jgi:hypothetical protein
MPVHLMRQCQACEDHECLHVLNDTSRLVRIALHEGGRNTFQSIVFMCEGCFRRTVAMLKTPSCSVRRRDAILRKPIVVKGYR